MKNFKKITSLLLVFAIAVACLGLVSCGGDNTCNHEWSEWTVKSEASCTHDGVKVRTCALCGNVDRVTEPATGHSNDDICTVCGALTLEIAPTFEDVNSVLFKIKDVEIVSTSASFTGSVELAELYLAVEDNELTGYGHGALNLTGPDGVVPVSAKVYIEGDTVYYEAEGLDALGMGSGDDSVYGSLSITEIIAEGMNMSPDELAAIIGSIYNPDSADVDGMSDKILEWIENELAPIFSDVALDVNMAKIEAIVNKGITNMLKIEEVDGGKTVTLDISKLKEWNADLQTKTIAELIDLLVGEGAFDSFKDSVDDILEYTVSDFLTYLRTVQGINPEKLLEALDKLAVIVTEDEDADFESLINIEEDLAELLTDEEFLSFSIGDALMTAMGAPSVEEVKISINMMLSTFELATVYDFITADATQMGAMVDQIIDMVDSMVSYVITVDGNGKFVKAETSIAIPRELTGSVSVSITETITKDGYVATVTMADTQGNEVEVTVETILGYESTADMTEYLAIKTKCENAEA